MPEQVKHNNMLVIFGKSQDHSPPKNWIHNSLQCKDPQTLSEIQVEQTISTYWPAAKWGRQRAPFEKKQESVQHILHYMGVSSFWKSHEGPQEPPQLILSFSKSTWSRGWNKAVLCSAHQNSQCWYSNRRSFPKVLFLVVLDPWPYPNSRMVKPCQTSMADPFFQTNPP